MSASLGNELPPTQLDSPASLIPEVPDVYAHFSRSIALAKEHFNGELGGKLLLYGQLDAQGAAVTLAANIAGAATLGVDADPERLRQGIRHGFCDFVVNNLDEALRILKNEIRKKQPVSVCLEGDLAATLQRGVERGLQPDLLALPAKDRRVRKYSSSVVQSLSTAGSFRMSFVDSRQLDRRVGSGALAAKVDGLAAQVLPEGDERSRWLKFAPSLSGANDGRTTLSPDDRRRSRAVRQSSVADATMSGAIGTKITIQRRERRLPEPPR